MRIVYIKCFNPLMAKLEGVSFSREWGKLLFQISVLAVGSSLDICQRKTFSDWASVFAPEIRQREGLEGGGATPEHLICLILILSKLSLSLILRLRLLTHGGISVRCLFKR